MKCEKCGTEIRQKAKFCPSCGNPIDWEEEPKKKMSKKMKALIVLVFVLVIGGIVYTKLPKTVDLHDYTTTCKVKGYNGFGTVSIECKWDKFTIDLAKYLKQKNKDMSESEVQSLVNRTDWDISASKEKGLSNGDVVKVKYDFDKNYLKEYGIVFKGATQKINVKNLKKVKKVDIFDGLELKYSGEGPTIQTDDYITIKKNGQKFECSVTPSSDLQVGDEVTVKYEGDKPVKGIYPKSRTIKLKVPKDLPHMITDPSELTKEDIDKIKEVANKIFKYQAPYTDIFEAWGDKSLIFNEDDREEAYNSKLISPSISDDMFFFAGDDIDKGTFSAAAVKCSANVKIGDEESSFYNKQVKCVVYCVIGPIKRDKDGKIKFEVPNDENDMDMYGSEFYRDGDGSDGNANANEAIKSNWSDEANSGTIYKVSVSGKSKPEVVEQISDDETYDTDEEEY